MVSPSTSRLLTRIALGAGVCAAFVLWFSAADTSLQLLANTVGVSAGAAALAVPLGTILAILLGRTRVWGEKLAVTLLATLLFLPLQAQLGGWDAAFGKLGWQTLAYHQTAQPLLAGMPAVIWIHAMASIAWVTLIVGVGLMSVPREQQEAALLETSPLGVLVAIDLPHLFPWIAVATLFVMITTAGEMTVTNIYLVRTYVEELYNSMARGTDAAASGVQLLPTMIATVCLVLLSLPTVLRLAPGNQLLRWREPIVLPSRSLGWASTLVLWCVLLLVAGVPLASLVYKAGFVVEQVGEERIRGWSAPALLSLLITTPKRFAPEFAWSVLFAALAATLALVIAIPLALLARRGGSRSLPALLVAALGWGLPGPLVGIGIIWLLNWNVAPLIWLYDKTPFPPALAQCVKALPVTILVIWYAFRSIHERVLENARLDGAGNMSLLFRILMPQSTSALTAAWLIAFAIGLGDLAWSILVLPPGKESIARRMFELLHYGVEEQVAAISLVITLQFAVLAGVVRWLLQRSKPT